MDDLDDIYNYLLEKDFDGMQISKHEKVISSKEFVNNCYNVAKHAKSDRIKKLSYDLLKKAYEKLKQNGK